METDTKANLAVWATNFNYMVIEEWSNEDNAERKMSISLAYEVFGEPAVNQAILDNKVI